MIYFGISSNQEPTPSSATKNYQDFQYLTPKFEQSKMAHTHPPSWIQRTSQDSTESEASKIDRLQQSNSKLTTENRWLRNVIRELEVANTLAGVEKRLSKTSIGIFEKVDLKYEVDFSDAQREQKKTWTGMLANIHLQRAAFDATGLESSREVSFVCSAYFL